MVTRRNQPGPAFGEIWIPSDVEDTPSAEGGGVVYAVAHRVVQEADKESGRVVFDMGMAIEHENGRLIYESNGGCITLPETEIESYYRLAFDKADDVLPVMTSQAEHTKREISKPDAEPAYEVGGCEPTGEGTSCALPAAEQQLPERLRQTGRTLGSVNSTEDDKP